MKIPQILLTAALLFSCSTYTGTGGGSGYTDDQKSDMRRLIDEVRDAFTNNGYNKSVFIHDGIDIVYYSESNSSINYNFIRSIDGFIQTKTYKGGTALDVSRRDSLHTILQDISDASSDCFIGTIESSSSANIDSFYIWNSELGYKTFATNDESFRYIPYPNKNDIINHYSVYSLSEAENFLMLTGYPIREDYETAQLNLIKTVNDSYHDIIVIQPEVTTAESERRILTSSELFQLQQKSNGSQRLVFASLNLTEVNEESLIWKDEWDYNLPSWLTPNGYRSYKVEFDNFGWSDALTASRGENGSYMDQLREAGFDGVVLTGISKY